MALMGPLVEEHVRASKAWRRSPPFPGTQDTKRSVQLVSMGLPQPVVAKWQRRTALTYPLEILAVNAVHCTKGLGKWYCRARVLSRP